MAPGGQTDLPTDLSGIRHRLNQEEGPRPHHEAIAAAVVALRAADAVVVGPLAPDDANSPGLLPHLADLASQAYRALRPPRELVVHPAFAQVARRFQYIQMSRQEARALCAGASDIGILAQRLRQLQGDPGEFAITAFGSRGLLWADETWWEIDPIGAGDIDEAVAAGVFCMAWVVARRFRRAGCRGLGLCPRCRALGIEPRRESLMSSCEGILGHDTMSHWPWTVAPSHLILMPELPDITIYVEALERRVIGERLDGVRIQSPLLLRTFDPPLDSVNGKKVREVRRLGKRIVLGLDDDLWLVLHLMIAGRLHWKEPGVKLATKSALAVFTFSNGTLLLH